MGGVLFVYNLEQIYIRHKMRAKVECSKTVFEKITLSKDDYKKSRINSCEISLDGKMYDVKTVTSVNDSMALLVINDSGETGILKKIKELINNVNDSQKIPNQLKKIAFLIYLLPTNRCTIILYASYTDLFQCITSDTLPVYSEKLGQPPKLV